jgi:glycosyltransferase involved in cell wall biosynthesis
MTEKKPKLSILMPVRNEGINIKLMLKILSVVVETPHEVLVIYDFANDDTVPVIRKMQPQHPNVRLIHNKKGKGVINAIRAGVEAAEGRYMLILVVDEIPPVLVVEDMLHLMEDGCDMVSVTRYAHGGRRLGGNVLQGILSRLGNKIFGWVAGSVLSDSTTGGKMFTKEAFKKVNLEAKPVGWAFAFEFAIKAQAVGLRLGEVSIVSVDRMYGGKSTFLLGPWFREYFRWFLWGIWNLHGKSVRKPLVRIPKTNVYG